MMQKDYTLSSLDTRISLSPFATFRRWLTLYFSHCVEQQLTEQQAMALLHAQIAFMAFLVSVALVWWLLLMTTLWLTVTGLHAYALMLDHHDDKKKGDKSEAVDPDVSA